MSVDECGKILHSCASKEVYNEPLTMGRGAQSRATMGLASFLPSLLFHTTLSCGILSAPSGNIFCATQKCKWAHPLPASIGGTTSDYIVSWSVLECFFLV